MFINDVAQYNYKINLFLLVAEFKSKLYVCRYMAYRKSFGKAESGKYKRCKMYDVTNSIQPDVVYNTNKQVYWTKKERYIKFSLKLRISHLNIV